MKANTAEALKLGTPVRIKLNNNSEHIVGSVEYVDTLGVQVQLNADDHDHHGKAVFQTTFFPWASVSYIMTDATIRNTSSGGEDTWHYHYNAYGWLTGLENMGGIYKIEEVDRERRQDAYDLYKEAIAKNELTGGSN